jgi:hypothetical protein
MQGRVKEPSGLFRIKAGDQLRGALDVGKQHGNLLALAFQVIARGQNFLSQVFGRVGCRGYNLGQRGGLRTNRLSAFEAKFGARWQFSTTPGARQPQTGGRTPGKISPAVDCPAGTAGIAYWDSLQGMGYLNAEASVQISTPRTSASSRDPRSG